MAQTVEYAIQKIVNIRNEFSWYGQKIGKELQKIDGIRLVLSISYRWLHKRFTKTAVDVQNYKKHKALVMASAPREVVEHDMVDLGGEIYAYISIDIFSKESYIYIGDNFEMAVASSKRLSEKPWKQ